MWLRGGSAALGPCGRPAGPPRAAVALGHSHLRPPAAHQQLAKGVSMWGRRRRGPAGLKSAGLDTFATAVSVGAVVGISISLGPALKLPEEEEPRLMSGSTDRRGGGAISRGEGDSFLWGLASFLSLVPLANWMAWVVLAQANEDEGKTPGLYYAFAGLYAATIFHDGILPGGSDIFVLLLGAVHVQVERVAQNEPQSIALPGPPSAQEAAAGLLMGARKALLGVSSSVETVAAQLPSEPELKIDPMARQDMRDFDKQLRAPPPDTKKRQQDSSDDDGWGS